MSVPTILTVDVFQVGTFTVDLGSAGTWVPAPAYTGPSWTQALADVTLDFLNGQYWSMGAASSLAALIAGTPVIVSGSGLRCFTGDFLTAIGQLATSLHAQSGFAIAKVSANLTNTNYPTIIRIGPSGSSGRWYWNFDPNGNIDASWHPRIGTGDENYNYAITPYDPTIVNVVKLGWGSTGQSGCCNQGPVRASGVPRGSQTLSATPIIGNNADGTDPLGGYLQYLAVGSVRPRDGTLRRMMA